MARHIPVVPTNDHGPHVAAKALAMETDGAWFGLHRDRSFHIRPSIPYEHVEWGPLTHMHRN